MSAYLPGEEASMLRREIERLRAERDRLRTRQLQDEILVGKLMKNEDRLRTVNAALLEALQRNRDYAWCALDQFQDRRGTLDISGFQSLIEVADEAIALAKGEKP